MLVSPPVRGQGREAGNGELVKQPILELLTRLPVVGVIEAILGEEGRRFLSRDALANVLAFGVEHLQMVEETLSKGEVGRLPPSILVGSHAGLTPNLLRGEEGHSELPTAESAEAIVRRG